MSSNSNNTITQKTLTGFGNIVKLLPTGTVFVFQFLNPPLTNNGHCHTSNKYLSSFLIAACGFSCFFSSFTDSYTDSQGNTYYGIVTKSGLWPNPTSPSSSRQDFSSYKLRAGDFVHAFFSLIVFVVVALLDPNSVECFYPSFESTQKALMMVMPSVIGVICGSLFMLFPNNRQGIGLQLHLQLQLKGHMY
ncbi:hypothetical protein BUALT_Bualt14G0082900 [Buddleja alternifolia]|uniref:DUF679 domain membrane protein 2 n=1 Tax=Buddleja alternifolia TaxID=168488 RepID=A0AAV6WSX7_9LAMI|nr:hypothetical protein BUALT_Bualt14G0082900 [Buddleja alternifolia]